MKWLCLIIFLLIAYGMLQPTVNRRMGWNLPTLAQLLGDESGWVEQDVAQPQRKQPTNSDVASVPKTRTTDNRSGTSDTQNDSLLYGLLRQTRRDEYVSPAGLRYTPGSEEGHRLEHLKKHLEDQPSRPGRHGVFHGDMPQVLRWLDDAYSRAKAGAKGTKKFEEDGRTVYEVTFSKPVGYVGGREGKRQNNPDSKRLRMVLDEDRLITAFPF